MKQPWIVVCLLVLMFAGFRVGKRNMQEVPRAPMDTSQAEAPEIATGDDHDHPAAKVSKRPRPELESPEAEFVRAKLRSIVLPVIAFDDATVEEAFDFLRMRSIELDPDPDPDRKKVAVVLRLPDSTKQNGQASPGEAPKVRRLVDIEARDISLWDALHLIAREANLKVVITDQDVELRPR